jgi:hypothetical protein
VLGFFAGLAGVLPPGLKPPSRHFSYVFAPASIRGMRQNGVIVSEFEAAEHFFARQMPAVSTINSDTAFSVL